MITGRKGNPVGSLGEDAEKLQPSGTARSLVTLLRETVWQFLSHGVNSPQAKSTEMKTCSHARTWLSMAAQHLTPQMPIS